MDAGGGGDAVGACGVCGARFRGPCDIVCVRSLAVLTPLAARMRGPVQRRRCACGKCLRIRKPNTVTRRTKYAASPEQVACDTPTQMQLLVRISTMVDARTFISTFNDVCDTARTSQRPRDLPSGQALLIKTSNQSIGGGRKRSRDGRGYRCSKCGQLKAGRTRALC